MNFQENKNPNPENMPTDQEDQVSRPVDTNQPMENSDAQNQTADPSSSNSSSKVIPLIIGAIVIALLMVAGAWYFVSSSDTNAPSTEGVGGSMTGQQSAFDFEEGNPDDVVATVNGVDLLQSQFNETRNQIAQAAQQQGLTPETEGVIEQINSQAMETLVNTELILQAAGAAGVSASDGAVDARLSEIVQSVGGEDALMDSLQQVGLTRESLRADLEQEVLIEAYLDTQLEEFTASAEEVSALYEQAAAGQELPPLEEIQGQVEQQVVATKRQEAVTQLVQSLRDAAEIDIQI